MTTPPRQFPPGELTKHILNLVPLIHNRRDWINLPPETLLLRLRKHAAWTLDQLGEATGLEKRTIFDIEKKPSLRQSARLMQALIPRLKKLRDQEWLMPDTLAINFKRYDELVSACIKLRIDAGISIKDLPQRMREEGVAPVHHHFETHAHSYELATVISIGDRLREFYRYESLDALLAKARTLPEPKRRYTREEQANIATALGAILNAVHMPATELVKPGIFRDANRIYGFICGRLLSTDTIERIPARVVEAYRETHPNEPIPYAARNTTLEEFTRKGLALAEKQNGKSGISKRQYVANRRRPSTRSGAQLGD